MPKGLIWTWGKPCGLVPCLQHTGSLSNHWLPMAAPLLITGLTMMVGKDSHSWSQWRNCHELRLRCSSSRGETIDLSWSAKKTGQLILVILCMHVPDSIVMDSPTIIWVPTMSAWLLSGFGNRGSVLLTKATMWPPDAEWSTAPRTAHVLVGAPKY